MPRSSPPSKTKATPVAIRNPSSIASNSPSVFVEGPTLGQSLKQGFGFGAGSAIAHGMFGTTPTVVISNDKKIESTCEKERIAFETCVKDKSTEDFCQKDQDFYKQCLSKNTSH